MDGLVKIICEPTTGILPGPASLRICRWGTILQPSSYEPRGEGLHLPERKPGMDRSRTALVTGANKGIGLEAARELGKLGFRVLVGIRNPERGMDIERMLVDDGIIAKFVRLDVEKQGTIDAVAQLIGDDFGSLDILVNNAGVFLESSEPPSQLEVSILRRTFDTNFFGMFAVTKSLLPLILKSPAGRIVNLSSSLGSLTLNRKPGSEIRSALAYNSSKAAVNMMTVLLSKELSGTSTKVNAVCPGYTATDLNNFQGTRTVQQACTAIICLATLAENGPTGGFFNENGPLSW